ncbi:MAG: M55 family metallopeptidase [Firmicutes bacterium]|nr:M55 family metallopeptidase [Bacillota bacterium]
MRVLIFADMEGISSIVTLAETGTKDGWWEKARVIMTNEVNSAIEGAVKAGATQIDVIDWHAEGANILPDKLHPEASLLRGLSLPVFLGSLVGKNTHDAAFIIGIHSRYDTPHGILAHTMNGVVRTEINGEPVGEVQLISALCSSWNIPVVLISGDKAAIDEANKYIPDAETVITKEGTIWTGARCFHPDKVCTQIEEKAKKSLKNLKNPEFYTLGETLNVTMSFKGRCDHTFAGDYAALIPTVTRVDGTTITFTCSSVIDYFRMLVVITSVVRQAYAEIMQ